MTKFRELRSVFAALTTFLLWLTLALAQNSPKYILTAPNVLRYDVEESVVITVFGTSEAVEVQVYLEEYPQRDWRTAEFSVLVEPDVPTEVKIVAPSSQPYTELDGLRYVYLVARCDSSELQFEKEVEVLVTPKNGLVFIQTDKPIYTPNQEVQFRIVQVDHKMRPRSTPVQIDIMNPRGTVVERKTDVAMDNGFYSRAYEFPILPIFGNWSIRVHYGANYLLSETVKFEVKEYVLPTFNVKVKVPEYILNKIYHVSIEVHAQYVYGKNVSGPVTLRLGIQTESELKIFGTKNGQMGPRGYVTSFSTRDLSNLGPDFWFINGAKLYVEAKVLEQETGTKEFGKSLSGRFVNAPYNIKMTNSRPHFKPGLPYTAKIDVLHVNGRPAKETGINVSLTYRDMDGDDIGRPYEEIAVTNLMGQAEVTSAHAPANAYTALISVTTQTEVRETEEFTIRASFSPSDSFILATVRDEQPIPVGDNLPVKISVTKPGDVSRLVYTVTTGANVVYKGTVSGESFPFTLTLPVTPAMSPSARILVYYIHEEEVVADSLLVDIVDRCENQVSIKTEHTEYVPDNWVTVNVRADPFTKVAMLAVDKAVYLMNSQDKLTPQKMFKDMQQFDTGCGVGSGLNSEDLMQNSGLTVLSSADIHGITRTDFGCAEMTTITRMKRRAMRIPQRGWETTSRRLNAEQCCARGRRSRSGTCVQRMGRELVDVTATCRTQFLKCCEERRTSPVRPTFEALRPEVDRPVYTSSGRPSTPTGRIGPTTRTRYTFEDIPPIEDVIDDIPARANFDETWFFNEIETDADGVANYETTAPSSITTWVFQAIGINQNSGICVAEPSRTKVFTNFFIQLSLPYSIIRQEQVEVKATIFNYGDVDLPIQVHSIVGPGVCAKSSPGEPSDPMYKTVGAHNSTTVTFPIVPLDVGEHSIEVIAVSPRDGYRDKVTRFLNVIAEGEPVVDVFNSILDPTGEMVLSDQPQNHRVHTDRRMMSEIRVQTDTVNLVPPTNAVPDSAQSRLSAIGTMFGSTVRQAIDGVQDMMQLPTGCGEQTMIKMAPTTYAALYLMETNQLTPEVGSRAAEFIASGYSNELKFRKDSGAFSVFVDFPGSTWLTAFVTKVFSQSMAVPEVTIEEYVICDAMAWLASKQREDGSFNEDQEVIHRELLGASPEDISLTAFVVVSMAESHLSCDGAREHSMQQARYYLESKLDEITDPYLVTVVAYALKISGSPRSGEAYTLMKAAARDNRASNSRWWSREAERETPTADDVEMTSYALLTVLKHDEMNYAKPIVTWLNLNRGSKAAFKSTQDTVVALQALSSYSSSTERNKALLLHSRVVRQNDSVEVLEFDLTEENTIVERQEELPHGLQYQILTEGVGTGQMTVELRYNVFTNSTLCHFDTNVTVKEVNSNTPWLIPDFSGDADNFQCPTDSDDGLADRGLELVSRTITSRIASHDRPQLSGRPSSHRFRSRSRFGGIRRLQPSTGRFYGPAVDATGGPLRRRGPQFAAIRSSGLSSKIIKLKVCTRFLASVDTGMSIIEVGLYSGFSAINESLARLKKCNSTTYVMNYEITSRTVVFYLSKVPHEQGVCLEFFTKQDHRVGNMQPVAVNVKDYYHPDDKCTSFYSPSGGSELLHYLCNRPNGQCTCSEGKCTKCYNVNKNRRDRTNPNYVREEFLPIGMSRTQELTDHVCEYSQTAYKVEVLEITPSESYSIIETQVLQVLKEGYRDTPVGSLVSFWVRSSCMHVCRKTLFEVGKKYLVTGPEGMHSVDITNTHRVTSTITDSNHVMEWFERSEARTRKERRLAYKLKLVTDRGCRSNSGFSFSRIGSPSGTLWGRSRAG